MNYTIHEDGIKFVSGALTGSGRKINIMYVEYGTTPGGPRTMEYFDSLSRHPELGGYVRIPVSHAYVDDEGAAHFDALLCKDDLPENAPDSVRVVCATLASAGKSGRQDDIFICTVPFGAPVPVLDGVYTSIHTSIKLGA